jgi:hypothetical protein
MFELFNRRRRDGIIASVTKIMDEMMSALRPRTTPRSNLPHLSYVMRKPEPLGKILIFLFLFVFI